ncbi:NIPSNAP family containing protein [Streptomyces longispororuber]|uniref:NIPSNAP family containing protein n=1 Tax=Streptomyces longispororuber TaxID=68230 RepID=A0A918ZIT7_9ACTN|nr:NIPSNAP family protein [Streptomyces longispororuber]GHE53767.1 NIPSNAP family containing protein [Streptomyces longispororuber]
MPTDRLTDRPTDRATGRPTGGLAVIELRQYTLRPGRRDELIDLFDREFVETQEETGMTVLGQFRDLDDPDRFVWLRGFPDMAARRHALTAFYDGPVWAEHGARANVTMLDSDDVLLLRPLAPGSGPAVRPADRPRPGAPAPDRFVSATVWSFPPGQHEGAVLLRDGLLPALRATGPAPLAVLATEPAPNTFPRLPVRTGENAVVVLGSYPDEHAHRRHLAALRTDPRARKILPAIEQAAATRPHTLRLTPTPRSLLT